MGHIIESVEGLYQAIAIWQWACVVGIFVFCVVLNKARYFTVFASLIVFAWVLRDLTNHVEFDPTYQWAFTGVVLAGVIYGVYLLFHFARGSGY